MKNIPRYLAPLLLMAVMTVPTIITGCSARVSTGYRVYDPGYSDYHEWNNGEVVYYNRWEGETHRAHVKDFRKRPVAEQNEYWAWRHNQH
jgi:hypothetical protein